MINKYYKLLPVLVKIYYQISLCPTEETLLDFFSFLDVKKGVKLVSLKKGDFSQRTPQLILKLMIFKTLKKH